MYVCSPAAYWGLVSALFASLTLLLFIHLYIIVRPPTKPPLRVLLLFTGVLSAVGVAAGVAGFATYLGLGITSTVDGDGEPAAGTYIIPVLPVTICPVQMSGLFLRLSTLCVCGRS